MGSSGLTFKFVRRAAVGIGVASIALLGLSAPVRTGSDFAMKAWLS